MASTDLIALTVMETALVLVSAFAVLKDIYIVRTERSRGLEVTVTRGDPAMNSLSIVYGIASIVYSLVAQVAQGIEGHRVIFIAFNYLLLTHLFFFSQWFRNALFFPVLNRAKRG